MTRTEELARTGSPLANHDPSSATELHVEDDARGRAAVAGLVAAHSIDTVFVAGASGGPSFDLPHTVHLVRWPTGSAVTSGFGSRRGSTLATVTPAGDVDPAPWIGWNALDSSARTSALPIWDGDYLLCPTALPGRSGAAALDAFTSIARAWSGIELVVLSDPDLRLVERARRLDVGPRIHFVGQAERSAEWAWWSHAAAGWLPAEVPVSGGLVLRALASGCPLVGSTEVEPGRSIARWLEAHGLATTQAGPAAQLNALLERGPEVKALIARGRAVAGAHDLRGLSTRLAAALATSDADAKGSRAGRRAA